MTKKNWTTFAALGFALIAALVTTASAEEPKKTLAECIAIALAEHPDIRSAEFAADAAHAETWQAISTALPQVNYSYSAQRRHTSTAASTGTISNNNTPGSGGTGGSGFSQTRSFNFYSTGITFSQILFDFGQSLYAIRSAQATERSVRAEIGTARDSVLLQVKQGYFNLLQARRLLEVADENVRDNQKHVDLAQGRLDVGVATRFDLTQAEVQLANAELQQVTARNNVAVARETFRNALGIDGRLDFDIVDTLDVHDVQVDADKAVALAFEQRPELRSLRFQQESLSDQIVARRLSYLPTINGSGNYTYSGTEYPLQNTWTVGAALNLNVFNGGLTTAEIDADKANLSRLESQEKSLQHQVELAVRQAALNLAQALESIRVSEKGLQSGRENLALAEGQYGAGVGNIIALTDAQSGLVTAEGNNVQALAGYQNALAALEQATAQSFAPEAAR